MFSSTSLLFYLFGGCSTCHHSAAKWDILLGVRDVPRSGKQIFGLVMPIPQMCLTPPIFSQVISPHPKPNISHSEHVFGMSTPEKITKNSFTSNAPVVHSQLVWTPASLCFYNSKMGRKICFQIKFSNCAHLPIVVVVDALLSRWPLFGRARDSQAIPTLQGVILAGALVQAHAGQERPCIARSIAELGLEHFSAPCQN